MWAPVEYVYELSTQSNYFIGFLIGMFFGFFLEQAGFGNANVLAQNFYFRNMTVVKVMFTAIITAMFGLIVMDHFHWIMLSEVWINPSYIAPGIVGGLIMGAGFIIGGYCPGTGIVGLATLKVDALFNILGAMFGMALTAEIIPHIYGFWTSTKVGDRTTLPEYFGLSPGLVGAGILVMALMMFAGSEWVEKRYGDQ